MSTEYRDPCEVIQEDNDEGSGGSGVPPVTPPEQPVEPLEFPFNEIELTDDIATEGVDGFNRRIVMLDSSNFYAGKSFRRLGLGLRTPGEIDWTVPTPTGLGPASVTKINNGSPSGRDQLEQENAILNSEANTLDLPPRDIFRHILGKVYCQQGAMSFLAHIDRLQPQKFTHEANGRQMNSHLYDYTESVDATVYDQAQPFLLYVWDQISLTPERSIFDNCRAELGLRFHLPTLKSLMRSTSRSRSFWNYDNIVDSSAEKNFVPERIREILDTWFYGPSGASPNMVTKQVNSKRNWLINEENIHEDCIFNAPASYDADLIASNPNLESWPLKNIVLMQSFSEQSDYLYRDDRNNLEVSLNSGALTTSDLPSQPYFLNETQRINYYSYLSSKIESQDEARDIEPGSFLNSISPIQKLSSKNVRDIKLYLENYEETDQNAQELLKQHVRITFQQHDSRIAAILDENSLDSLVLDVFYQSENNQETFTQIIDNDNYNYVEMANDDRNVDFIEPSQSAFAYNADNIALLTTPKKVRDFFFLLEQQNDLMEEDQEYFEFINSHYPFGTTTVANEWNYEEDTDEWLQGWYERARLQIKEVPFFSGRSYLQLLKGNKARSEVLAYKIVKKLASTGEVIQTFLISNEQASDSRQITFIDTQVVPQETYEYSIFTINAVAGSEYRYINASHMETLNGDRSSVDLEYEKNGFPGQKEDKYESKDLSNEYYRITVRLTNHLYLIEAPYYQRTVSLGDYPPVRPDVTFLPELGRDDTFTILFQQNINSLQSQKPIPILPEDFSTLASMFSAQSEIQYSSVDNPGEILYKSISDPLVFEMMILDEAPSSYSDFSRAIVTKTDFRNPFIQFKVNINKTYYMIARSVDRPGFSNPTEVFKVRMESHEDGINPIFERYNMQQSHAPAEVEFQNIISIEPSQLQKKIDFSKVLDPGQEYRRRVVGESFYDTAPDIVDIALGDNQDSFKKVWGRKFKFRFKSKLSNNSIDINVAFDKNRIEVEESSINSQQNLETGQLPVSPLAVQDLRTDQRYRYDSAGFNEDEFDTTEPRDSEPAQRFGASYGFTNISEAIGATPEEAQSAFAADSMREVVGDIELDLIDVGNVETFLDINDATGFGPGYVIDKLGDAGDVFSGPYGEGGIGEMLPGSGPITVPGMISGITQEVVTAVDPMIGNMPPGGAPPGGMNIDLAGVTDAALPVVGYRVGADGTKVEIADSNRKVAIDLSSNTAKFTSRGNGPLVITGAGVTNAASAVQTMLQGNNQLNAGIQTQGDTTPKAEDAPPTATRFRLPTY